MAKTLATTVELTLNFQYRNPLDLQSPKGDATISFTDALTTGTGVDNADLLWSDRRTVSASGADALDLAGALTDAFGATLTFARIKGIYIHNRNTVAGDIIQVGAGSNPLLNWVKATGDGVNVVPGGCFFIYAPSAAAYALTGGASDVLTITEIGTANSNTYDIVIFGASA